MFAQWLMIDKENYSGSRGETRIFVLGLEVPLEGLSPA